MERTFPAIKKQVDVLEQAGIVTIHKDAIKWSITVCPDIYPLLKNLFVFWLKNDLARMMISYTDVFEKYYLWTVFGNDIGVDLILVYTSWDAELLEKTKVQISDLFKSYGIELVYMTIMSKIEWDKRLALADKFVLSVLRVTNGEKI